MAKFTRQFWREMQMDPASLTSRPPSRSRRRRSRSLARVLFSFIFFMEVDLEQVYKYSYTILMRKRYIFVVYRSSSQGQIVRHIG